MPKIIPKKSKKFFLNKKKNDLHFCSSHSKDEAALSLDCANQSKTYPGAFAMNDCKEYAMNFYEIKKKGYFKVC